jgi:AraC-like DNA-binding protein
MKTPIELTWPLRALPRILTAGHFPLSDSAFRYRYQSPTHALHLHEYDGEIEMDGCVLPLTPGTVTLSPAGGITHWCIHFTPAPLRKPLITIPLHVQTDSAPAQIAHRMAHITALQSAAAQSQIARAATSLALQELLLLLAYRQPQIATSGYQSHADDAVDRLLELIHRRLDQPLRITDLADEVQLSQNYLAMRFRQRMGMTIPRYILQSRIQRAQLLLSTTNLPIKQIAAQVGMPDPQHFNKQFRHMTGNNPTAIRTTC